MGPVNTAGGQGRCPGVTGSGGDVGRGEGWTARCRGAHADVCDLSTVGSRGVIWRSSGCRRGRRAGRQARRGVTREASAIADSASDPALLAGRISPGGRVVKGGQCFLSRGVEVARWALPRWGRVRRGLSPSTSLVLAALRALHVDISGTVARGQRSRKSPACGQVQRGVVVGLVADQGVRDPVGPVRHRASDHAALLPASAHRVAVGLGRPVVEPQSDAEVDQGATQLDAAFPADCTIEALPADSYCIGDRPTPGRSAAGRATARGRRPRRRRRSRLLRPSQARWSGPRTVFRGGSALRWTSASVTCWSSAPSICRSLATICRAASASRVGDASRAVATRRAAIRRCRGWRRTG
jgi:hypothetical protein